ncbi:FprA family A-type flavoprotein [Fusobacterium sp. MFO224]|uniref:FprA family A-type flavoprotein n=1 Tax=Fusobacterium sp. MFO224 TaxID=3378070 RepID=UPI003852F570
MNLRKIIGEDIYWIGINDRKTQRFENYLPLPYGVTYNSYLIDDEKVCLIDTVETGSSAEFLRKIKHVIGERKIDYLIVNHMEPDHSGAMGEIMEMFPEIKVVGNMMTLKMIKAFYHDFDENRFQAVKEGEELNLGRHTLVFATIPMVHWPESMVTYDKTEKILFSNDAFGGFGALNGGLFDDEVEFNDFKDEMRRYYANIVGKYGMQVNKAISKLGSLDIKYICPSHGLLWKEKVGTVIKLYSDWANFIPEEKGVVIAYGTMYGNTEKMAEIIAKELFDSGIKNVKIYDVSKTDSSIVISDVWKYQGLILGSCAHNNALYPKMLPVVEKLKNYGVKNRYLGIFGNMMWSGGGVKALDSFAAETKGIEKVGESVEAKGAPTEEIISKLKKLAKEMADKILA